MSFLATLKDAYAEYSSNYDLNELVRGTFGAAQLGFDTASNPNVRIYDTATLTAMKKNMTQSVLLPAIQRGGVTVRTTRGALPLTPTFGDSAQVAVVFNTHEVEFSVIAEEYRGNQISKEDYIAAKLFDADRELMNAIDLEAVTAIDAAKAQLTNSATPYPFTTEFSVLSAVTSTTEQARLSEWSNFLLYLESIVTADGHVDAGMARFYLSSPNGKALVNHAAQYGGSNQYNLQPQWGGINQYISTNITEGTGAPVERSNGYFLLPKSFETHSWLSGDAIEGFDNGEKTLTTEFSSILNREVEQLYIKDLTNQSARNAKNTRVATETFVRTIETAQVVAYNSDSATYPDRLYGVSFQVGV